MIPGKVQSLGEMAYLFIRDGIARETIGPAGDKWVPLLFSTFFSSSSSTSSRSSRGAVPGAVSHRLPGGAGLMVWVIYMFLGLRHRGR